MIITGRISDLKEVRNPSSESRCQLLTKAREPVLRAREFLVIIKGILWIVGFI